MYVSDHFLMVKLQMTEYYHIYQIYSVNNTFNMLLQLSSALEFSAFVRFNIVYFHFIATTFGLI